MGSDPASLFAKPVTMFVFKLSRGMKNRRTTHLEQENIVIILGLLTI